MRWLSIVVVALMSVLSGCALFQDQPVVPYQLAARQHFKAPEVWTFDGRIALSNEKDSISAAILWQHQKDRDVIELAGPLAQGKMQITVTADAVVIDDGDKSQEYRGVVEDIISAQIGIDVPVQSLKYWVLGLNDPAAKVSEQVDGFSQSGWQIKFKGMQAVKQLQLPHKMAVEKELTRIKLIVDRWEI